MLIMPEALALVAEVAEATATMEIKVPLEIRAEQTSHPATQGWLTKLRLTRQQRLRRASKAWLIAWGLMIPAAIIPLFHFVLLPMLFIAGIALGILRYRVTEISTAAEITCPVCAQHAMLKVDANMIFPGWESCSQCDAPVQLRLVYNRQMNKESA
jgi:hypothetical protein